MLLQPLNIPFWIFVKYTNVYFFGRRNHHKRRLHMLVINVPETISESCFFPHQIEELILKWIQMTLKNFNKIIKFIKKTFFSD